MCAGSLEMVCVWWCDAINSVQCGDDSVPEKEKGEKIKPKLALGHSKGNLDFKEGPFLSSVRC